MGCQAALHEERQKERTRADRRVAKEGNLQDHLPDDSRSEGKARQRRIVEAAGRIVAKTTMHVAQSDVPTKLIELLAKWQPTP